VTADEELIATLLEQAREGDRAEWVVAALRSQVERAERRGDAVVLTTTLRAILDGPP
jgi:hypothetical protein